MKFYIGHEGEHDRSVKRGGDVAHMPLDPAEADRRWQLASASALDPEHTFERAWALAVLDAALARLEVEMQTGGKVELFARLKPFLASEPDAASLRSIAADLNSTEGAVRGAAYGMHTAGRAAIQAEVASTLDDVRDLDDEVRDLFAALGN